MDQLQPSTNSDKLSEHFYAIGAGERERPGEWRWGLEQGMVEPDCSHSPIDRYPPETTERRVGHVYEVTAEDEAVRQARQGKRGQQLRGAVGPDTPDTALRGITGGDAHIQDALV